jgi:hypothetical protein
MSKRNRDKRSSDKTSSMFPFRLLQAWIKPFESGLPCRHCTAEANYSMQSFYDLNRMQHLISIGYTPQEALNVVWDESLTGQLQGNYTVGHVHYACRACTFKLIATSVGDDVATLAMLPMLLLGDRASVVIGAELSARDDEGLTFAGMAQARNVDELLMQLKGETMSIKLTA